MNKDSCCRLLHIMHVVRHILPPHIARCQKNEIISFLTVICNFISATGYCIIISCMSLDTHPVPRCFVSKKLRLFPLMLNALYIFISATGYCILCMSLDKSFCPTLQGVPKVLAISLLIIMFLFSIAAKRDLKCIDQQSAGRQGIERRQGIESSLKLLFFQGAVRCQSAKN